MSKFLMLDDYVLPGHGLMVQGALEIKNEELSGETSSTSTVNKGVKPKQFTVSLQVPYTEVAGMKKLTATAEAKDTGDRMRIYDCVNDTVNAMGVRQVQFTDRFAVNEAEGVRAWDVSFTLREFQSRPEMVEQRESAPKTVTQSSSGAAVDLATAEEQQTAQAVAEPLTLLEKLLKAVDSALGSGTEERAS
ncbi:baseplate complex protein [Desulfovibrio psychrotolerans]|nr:DNA-binding protein [Desulfovibrio psychrotolerans]